MSARDLKPTGIPFSIDEHDRHLLFNLNVLDDIQEHFDAPITDVLNMMRDKKTQAKTIRYVLYAFLADDADNNGHPMLTEKDIGRKLNLENAVEASRAITSAIIEGSPKPKQKKTNQESKNVRGEQQKK